MELVTQGVIGAAYNLVVTHTNGSILTRIRDADIKHAPEPRAVIGDCATDKMLPDIAQLLAALENALLFRPSGLIVVANQFLVHSAQLVAEKPTEITGNAWFFNKNRTVATLRFMPAGDPFFARAVLVKTACSVTSYTFYKGTDVYAVEFNDREYVANYEKCYQPLKTIHAIDRFNNKVLESGLRNYKIPVQSMVDVVLYTQYITMLQAARTLLQGGVPLAPARLPPRLVKQRSYPVLSEPPDLLGGGGESDEGQIIPQFFVEAVISMVIPVMCTNITAYALSCIEQQKSWTTATMNAYNPLSKKFSEPITPYDLCSAAQYTQTYITDVKKFATASAGSYEPAFSTWCFDTKTEIETAQRTKNEMAEAVEAALGRLSNAQTLAKKELHDAEKIAADMLDNDEQDELLGLARAKALIQLKTNEADAKRLLLAEKEQAIIDKDVPLDAILKVLKAESAAITKRGEQATDAKKLIAIAADEAKNVALSKKTNDTNSMAEITEMQAVKKKAKEAAKEVKRVQDADAYQLIAVAEKAANLVAVDLKAIAKIQAEAEEALELLLTQQVHALQMISDAVKLYEQNKNTESANTRDENINTAAAIAIKLKKTNEKNALVLLEKAVVEAKKTVALTKLSNEKKYDMKILTDAATHAATLVEDDGDPTVQQTLKDAEQDALYLLSKQEEDAVKMISDALEEADKNNESPETRSANILTAADTARALKDSNADNARGKIKTALDKAIKTAESKKEQAQRMNDMEKAALALTTKAQTTATALSENIKADNDKIYEAYEASLDAHKHMGPDITSALGTEATKAKEDKHLFDKEAGDAVLRAAADLVNNPANVSKEKASAQLVSNAREAEKAATNAKNDALKLIEEAAAKRKNDYDSAQKNPNDDKQKNPNDNKDGWFDNLGTTVNTWLIKANTYFNENEDTADGSFWSTKDWDKSGNYTAMIVLAGFGAYNYYKQRVVVSWSLQWLAKAGISLIALFALFHPFVLQHDHRLMVTSIMKGVMIITMGIIAKTGYETKYKQENWRTIIMFVIHFLCLFYVLCKEFIDDSTKESSSYLNTFNVSAMALSYGFPSLSNTIMNNTWQLRLKLNYLSRMLWVFVLLLVPLVYCFSDSTFRSNALQSIETFKTAYTPTIIEKNEGIIRAIGQITLFYNMTLHTCRTKSIYTPDSVLFRCGGKDVSFPTTKSICSYDYVSANNVPVFMSQQTNSNIVMQMFLACATAYTFMPGDLVCTTTGLTRRIEQILILPSSSSDQNGASDGMQFILCEQNGIKDTLLGPIYGKIYDNTVFKCSLQQIEKTFKPYSVQERAQNWLINPVWFHYSRNFLLTGTNELNYDEFQRLYAPISKTFPRPLISEVPNMKNEPVTYVFRMFLLFTTQKPTLEFKREIELTILDANELPNLYVYHLMTVVPQKANVNEGTKAGQMIHIIERDFGRHTLTRLSIFRNFEYQRMQQTSSQEHMQVDENKDLRNGFVYLVHLH